MNPELTKPALRRSRGWCSELRDWQVHVHRPGKSQEAGVAEPREPSSCGVLAVGNAVREARDVSTSHQAFVSCRTQPNPVDCTSAGLASHRGKVVSGGSGLTATEQEFCEVLVLFSGWRVMTTAL